MVNFGVMVIYGALFVFLVGLLLAMFWPRGRN